MIQRPTAIALARAVNVAFFLATSIYCLLAFSPFAYQVLLKPEVIPLVTDFVATHVALFWLVLLITALTLRPYVGLSRGVGISRGAGLKACETRARWIARAYLVVGAVVGAALIVRPVMTTVGNTRRSLYLGMLALAPPIWLAIVDHLVAPPASVEPSNAHRALGACAGAAACVWAAYAIGVPFRLHGMSGVELSTAGVLVGVGSSAVAHFFVFMAIFLGLTAIGAAARMTRAPGTVEYWTIVAAAAATIALLVYGLVFASITLVGVDAAGAAAAMGIALALAWSGVACWHRASQPTTRWTALQMALAPVVSWGSRVASTLVIVSLPLIAYALVGLTGGFDWNFVIQKLGVVLVWVVAFATVHAALAHRDPTSNGWILAVPPLVALALFQGGDVVAARAQSVQEVQLNLNLDLLLDRYSAVDPSFRFVRDLRMARSRDTADFYTYLRANSLVLPSRVEPAAIEFGRPVRTASRPPHIFLFLVDSLRRDYLAPYNPAVTFTPSIGKFAADSFVFERAFTRYSGTGLAVPSIWAGGMLIHMIDQRPFHTRNALWKLLDANGYRLVMGVDSVMRDLIPEGADLVELDRGVPSMECDFCRTLGELEAKLAAAAADRRPVFSYTLPQNVHIAVASKRHVPPGRDYSGFVAPVAESVRLIDECFGEFIMFLQRSKLYDDSIVIVSSDHGDSLGEEGRWGHSYFMVPEVMRVPLIVHLPAALRGRFAADLSRVSFSTDITPTLYALLGHEPADLGPLFGASLFVRPGADLATRRRESFLLASSYGAVYGMLRHNGRTLYGADAVDGREGAYDLSDGGLGRRIVATEALSSLNRRLISAQLGELAALNHFTPQP